MKRILSLALFAPSLWIACGGNTTPADMAAADMASPDMTTLPPPQLAVACNDAITDVYVEPTGLPAYDSSHRGDVVRCAKDRSLTAAQVNAALTIKGFTGTAGTQGVTIYRIGYRTDRSEAGKSGVEGYASAVVLIPDVIAAPGGLVVTGHGSVGLATKCAPSLFDFTTANDNDAAQTMALAPAGEGVVTIAPDFAGYAGGAVQGWALAEDEAHSLLDATRAMKNILPAAEAPTKVVIVGHSAGGHAVLSAQALAGSYGTAGKVVGVVAFAPLWVPQTAWGAVLSPSLGFTTDGAYASIIAYGTQYFYGHGEILDGAGGGLVPFQTAKQQAVKTMLTGSCNSDYGTEIKAIGMTPSDFFDDAWSTSVSLCALGGDCSMEPAKSWRARFTADRPPIDVNGAPTIVWHGQMDSLVQPGYAQCDIDKFAADEMGHTGNTGTVSICIDPMATHSSVVERQMDYVDQWIASLLLGKTAPVCAQTSFNPPIKCSLPVANN